MSDFLETWWERECERRGRPLVARFNPRPRVLDGASWVVLCIAYALEGSDIPLVRPTKIVDSIYAAGKKYLARIAERT